MLEEREWLGTWSIFSDDPERVFQGLLTYSPKNGGELKIGKQNAYWDEFRLLDQTQLIPIIKGYDYHSGKR
ncbi:hypothetical protein GO730_24860 [Spirosoma sp. HMF3257]|uniref:Uncharacterized protein n=1 Tax=Spirosoma telluris TaxID=2183553 RepID=A0A327NPB1_9BACT|nr:hypothetical protein [Spirosoma telluris]RAI76575.1 hypothetical protein HMF3257_24800 [Spirosoma telluris]